MTDPQKARDYKLRQRYGIGLEEYKEMLANQGGLCAICRGKRSYPLDVDHDHKTGKIRGLLCKMCNHRLLPACHDDVVLLLRAVAYLRGGHDAVIEFEEQSLEIDQLRGQLQDALDRIPEYVITGPDDTRRMHRVDL